MRPAPRVGAYFVEGIRDMPADFMDWVVIVGVGLTALGVLVAFMRRPKKTTNVVKRGDGNTLTGGDGTTSNTVEDGNNNTLGG